MTHRYSQSMHRPAWPTSGRRAGPRAMFLATMLIACSLASPLAAGADDPPPVPAPSPAPTQPTTPAPSPTPPKSLDDLLGVPQAPDAKSSSADDAARREQEKRLAKSLDEASMEDLVQQAIAGMKDASDRLSTAKDSGLGTQRIQEDVVKTLDRLLEEAQRRQSKKQSSSSSSKKKPSKQQQKDEPSEQNGQQQRQRQSGQRESMSKPGDSTEAAQDGTRDDAVAAIQDLAETRIEWGQLPERVRELVLQGRRDRVSTIYERLTREYYRRLAEEASR